MYNLDLIGGSILAAVPILMTCSVVFWLRDIGDYMAQAKKNMKPADKNNLDKRHREAKKLKTWGDLKRLSPLLVLFVVGLCLWIIGSIIC